MARDGPNSFTIQIFLTPFRATCKLEGYGWARSVVLTRQAA